MNKLILSLSILFCSTLLFSQDYNEMGIVHLQHRAYQAADSMFTLAINSYPLRDSYYNRAIARLRMNKMEGFCKDMRNASNYSDVEAEEAHGQYCIDVDTLYYNKKNEVSEEKTEYFEIKKQEKYYDLTEGLIYNKNKLIAQYWMTDSSKCFTKTSIPPRFKGGNKMFLKFIKNNIQYPEDENDAYNQSSQNSVTVYVQFDVTATGKVTNVILADWKNNYMKKYISQNFVNEALRGIRSAPDFRPGKFLGKRIDFRYQIPVTFNFPKR